MTERPNWVRTKALDAAAVLFQGTGVRHSELVVRIATEFEKHLNQADHNAVSRAIAELQAAMAKLDEPVRVEVSTALGDSWLYRMYRERFSSESSYTLQITGKKSVPITTGELWLYKNRAAHRRALRLATQRRRIARRRGVPAKLVDVVTWIPRVRGQVTPIADAIARAVAGVAPLQASFEAADTAAEQWSVAEGNEPVFLDDCTVEGCPGGHGYSEEED